MDPPIKSEIIYPSEVDTKVDISRRITQIFGVINIKEERENWLVFKLMFITLTPSNVLLTAVFLATGMTNKLP